MKIYPFLFLIFIITSNCSAQIDAKEELAIKNSINMLFVGMRNADTTSIKSAFSPKVIMQTIVTSKDGKSAVRTESLQSFLKSIAAPHPEKYDERIKFTKILVDANLASVWTDYRFYVGDKFSHCGVNSFQLLKSDEGWKIIYLIDTRRKEPCIE